MKIAFVLPRYAPQPVGGFKVAYEYANGLQQRGHQVTIVHPYHLEPERDINKEIRSWLWPHAVKRRPAPIPWFAFESGVELRFVPNLEERWFADADVLVATSWRTAELLQGFSVKKGVRFYLVYDYEFWMTEPEPIRERMARTYRGDYRLIATSPAVEQMFEEVGVRPTASVYCGLDLGIYGIDTPIEARDKGTVGFPIREEEFKGASDALEAVCALKARHGDALRIAAFAKRRPPDLPDWVDFREYPTDAQLREFYNSRSIFLFPSHYEGWGLPGVEAMACGATLVTADCVGNRDYAINEQTALVVPRKRPDLLAAAVETLLANDDLRRKLARQGNVHSRQYTWDRACNQMETALLNGRS